MVGSRNGDTVIRLREAGVESRLIAIHHAYLHYLSQLQESWPVIEPPPPHCCYVYCPAACLGIDVTFTVGYTYARVAVMTQFCPCFRRERSGDIGLNYGNARRKPRESAFYTRSCLVGVVVAASRKKEHYLLQTRSMSGEDQE